MTDLPIPAFAIEAGIKAGLAAPEGRTYTDEQTKRLEAALRAAFDELGMERRTLKRGKLLKEFVQRDSYRYESRWMPVEES